MALIDDPAVDLADLARRFEGWLQRQPGGAGRTVAAFDQASRANGFSNETYRVRVSGPDEDLILRLPPARTGLFPGYDLGRQFGIMQVLQGEAGLAMAPVKAFEADPTLFGRPFFVTAFVEGQVAADRPCYVREGWLADATPAQRQRLWRGSIDQLGRLARVQWPARTLARFDWLDRATPRSVQHLRYWATMARWGREQLPAGDTRLFEDLQRWLERERPLDEEAGVVWGDARFGNMIFRDFAPVALLDWELAVVGDPMLDVAYLLFHVFLMELLHGDEDTAQRFAGFEGDETSVAQWCEAAGRSPACYRWCWLFNAWKMLAIWECKAALLWRTGQATLEEALEVRRAARLLPHIAAVWQSGSQGAYLRRPPSPSASRAPAGA